MKYAKKWFAVLSIVVLLLPLIPIPPLSDFFTTDSEIETEINVEAYRKNEQTEGDIYRMEEMILQFVNELREDLDLSVVDSNDMLKAGAIVRAQETEKNFSHTRPDGREPFTVLSENGVEYNYQTVGENLAMSTYFLEETEMAQFLFDGWIESEGHYQTMINPMFNEIGVGVHYDGEMIYATQIFGRQR